MKLRIVRRIVASIIIISIFIWGIMQKKTYTDFLSDPDGLNQFQVAEFIEELIPNLSEQMLNVLPESSIIIRAKATEEKEYLFLQNKQTVLVEEIYQGEGLEKGQEIDVALKTSFSFDEGKLAEFGFVNEMEEGKEYLIFLERKIDALEAKGKRDIYYVAESLITPVFCYEDKENTIIDVSGQISTYVDYELVKDNEFFAASQKALDGLLEIKKQLLERYPRS